MRPEVTQKLINAYPVLYSKPSHGNKIIGYPFILFMFEVGDGWYNIIDKLSAKLEKYNDSHPNLPVVAVRVKEIFGALQFTVSSIGSAGNLTLIKAAEAESELICEGCGELGIIVNLDNWLKTLCESCHADILDETKE